MATKNKKQEEEDNRPTYLKISKEEAERKLADRIRLGEDIYKRTIGSEGELDTARADKGRWSDYNAELLGQIFTTDLVKNDYLKRYNVVVGFFGPLQLAREVHNFQIDLSMRIEGLKSILERLPLFPLDQSMATPAITQTTRVNHATKKVFVVHGHDDGRKETVARFLTKLGLEPVILHEHANEGKTIIEKFEKHSADVGFAVVILTPDDVGGPRKTEEDAQQQFQSRARQNVILELGYFLGALGRNKVCALYVHGIENPSDMNGVLYVAFDDGDWRLKLAKEIRAAGIPVDLNDAI